MFPKTLKNSPKHKLYPCVPKCSHALITVIENFSNLLVHGIITEYINKDVHMVMKCNVTGNFKSSSLYHL